MSTSLREYGHVFIGDCAVGKTTLANTLAEGELLKASSSIEEGSSAPSEVAGQSETTSQTRQAFKWPWRNGGDQHTKHYVIDTRGFSSDDAVDRDQAAAQLDILMNQPINLNIIFVVQFDNGRPRFHDALVIDVVMTALEQRGTSVASASTATLSRYDKINLIVNKVSDDVVQQAKAFGGQMFDRTICNERMKVLLGKRYTNSPHVLYIPHVSSLHSNNRKAKTSLGSASGMMAANGNGTATTSMTATVSTTSLTSTTSTTSSSSTVLSVVPNRCELVTFINKAKLTKHRTERAHRVNFPASDTIARINFEQRLQSFELKFYPKLRPPMSFVLSAVQPCARREAVRAVSELDTQLREVLGQQQRNITLLQDSATTGTEETRRLVTEMQMRETGLRERLDALEEENRRLRETQRKCIVLLKPLVDAARMRAVLGPEEWEEEDKVEEDNNSVENGSQTSVGAPNGGSGSPNRGLPKVPKTGGSSLRAPNSRIPKMKKRAGKSNA